GGRFTEAGDAFAHPCWDTVRERISGKAIEMRRQGFFGAAMLPMTEREYTGIVVRLESLTERFEVRGARPPATRPRRRPRPAPGPPPRRDRGTREAAGPSPPPTRAR